MKKISKQNKFVQKLAIALAAILLLGTLSPAFVSAEEIPFDVSEQKARLDVSEQTEHNDSEDGEASQNADNDGGTGGKVKIISSTPFTDHNNEKLAKANKKTFRIMARTAKGDGEGDEFNTNEFLTFDAAAKKFKEALLNKESPIVLKIKSSTYESTETLRRDLLAEIGKHTGIDNEGDYLRFNSWIDIAGEQQVGEAIDDTDSNKYFLFNLQNINYYLTAEEEEDLTDTLQRLANSLKGDTDYETVKNIHDYLVDNVTYDTQHGDGYSRKFTAYAAVMDKTAVCEGYALMFYRLCLLNGIDARYITGTPTSHQEAHAWNIVKLGDKYYNVDNTWDAGEKGIDGNTMKYFLIGKNNFNDHVRDAEYDTNQFHTEYPMSDEDYGYHEASISINDKPSNNIIQKEVEFDDNDNIKDDFFRLTYTYDGPDIGDVIWTSSNEDVATVDDEGLVTMTGLGETIITVSTGNDISDSITIKVVKKEDTIQEIEEINAEESEFELSVGESKTIAVTTTPSGADVESLLWESANTGIATVTQDGTVTAIAPGTVTITVKSQSESASKTFTIHVKQANEDQEDDGDDPGTGNDNTDPTGNEPEGGDQPGDGQEKDGQEDGGEGDVTGDPTQDPEGGEGGEGGGNVTPSDGQDGADNDTSENDMFELNKTVFGEESARVGDKIHYSIRFCTKEQDGKATVLEGVTTLQLRDTMPQTLEFDSDSLTVAAEYSHLEETAARLVQKQLSNDKFESNVEQTEEGTVLTIIINEMPPLKDDETNDVLTGFSVEYETTVKDDGNESTDTFDVTNKVVATMDDDESLSSDCTIHVTKDGSDSSENTGENEQGEGQTDDGNKNDESEGQENGSADNEDETSNNDDNSQNNDGDNANKNEQGTSDTESGGKDSNNGASGEKDENTSSNTDDKNDASGDNESKNNDTSANKNDNKAIQKTVKEAFQETVKQVGDKSKIAQPTTTKTAPATLNATPVNSNTSVSQAAKSSPVQTSDNMAMYYVYGIVGLAAIATAFAIRTKRAKAK